jgi:hypothetical protein
MLVPDATGIRNFLKDNINILDVLPEAEEVLFSIFGDVKLEMLLSTDPSEGTQIIFIVIHCGAIGANELLDEFDEEWFIDNRHKFKGKLNFTVN